MGSSARAEPGNSTSSAAARPTAMTAPVAAASDLFLVSNVHLPSTPVDGRRGRRTRVKRKRVGSGTSRCEGPSAPSGPCLVAVRDRSETPAARRLDPDEISRGEVARDLRGNLLAVQEIAPEGSRLAAPCALRCPSAALADERQAARIEHPQLPNDPLAAAVTPTPPGA